MSSKSQWTEDTIGLQESLGNGFRANHMNSAEAFYDSLESEVVGFR